MIFLHVCVKTNFSFGKKTRLAPEKKQFCRKKVMFPVRKVVTDIIDVSVTLFKIMIPTLIVVKLLQEIGVVELLNHVLSPVMGVLGLPSEMAVVLTTNMLTNPYAGLIVASSLPELSSLSVAQMSVLASFMLFTHSLPVEALISRKAGVRLRATIGLRVAAGFIMGILLHQFCQATGWLSEPAVPNLPEFSPDTSLSGWIISQIKGLIFVQIVIIVLLFFLEFLRMIGVERLIKLLLSPFLKLMKIGDRASTIAVVGVTLGLGFGGGLLIRDVATGTIHKRDVFGVLCFINLLHSIFEDTAVVMLLGPSLLVVLAMRTIFAIIMTLVVMMLATRLPEAIWDSQLVNRNIPEPAQMAER